MKKLTKQLKNLYPYVLEDNLPYEENSLKLKELLVTRLGKYEQYNTAKPIEKWDEDYGDCLFWNLETLDRYCGTPLDYDWKEGYSDYYTHFTMIMNPIIIEED